MQIKKSRASKILSLFLAVIMIIGILPTQAFASGMGNISSGGITIPSSGPGANDAWTPVPGVSMFGYRISVWYSPLDEEVLFFCLFSGINLLLNKDTLPYSLITTQTKK
jgi:hypothetical protein